MKGVAIMLNADMQSTNNRPMSPFMVAMVGMFFDGKQETPETETIDWEGLL
jgi:hypothetical protein